MPRRTVRNAPGLTPRPLRRCFYNTIVQSLSATQPLNDIIQAAPDSSPALRTLSPASSDYNPDLDALASPLPMTAALLVLLDKLDPTDNGDGTRGKKAFNPKGLLRQLSLKHDEYAEATQQDSHELLRHLIDGVMMEEQDVRRARPPCRCTSFARARRLTPSPPRSQLIKKIVELVPDADTEAPHRPGMPDRNATEMPLPNGAAHPALAAAEDDDGHESDASSSSSGSSSSSSSSDDESDADERALSPRERKKRQLRPFVGSIFEGKLASFIICDECKNGASSSRSLSLARTRHAADDDAPAFAVSLTKEDFMDISLPLRDDAGNKMRKVRPLPAPLSLTCTLADDALHPHSATASAARSRPASSRASRARRRARTPTRPRRRRRSGRARSTARRATGARTRRMRAAQPGARRRPRPTRRTRTTSGRPASRTATASGQSTRRSSRARSRGRGTRASTRPSSRATRPARRCARTAPSRAPPRRATRRRSGAP